MGVVAEETILGPHGRQMFAMGAMVDLNETPPSLRVQADGTKAREPSDPRTPHTRGLEDNWVLL